MYGTPHGDFEVKGTVVDENNKPVPNAKILLREGRKIEGDFIWDNDDRWCQATTSDIKGTYSLKGHTMFDNVRIVCKPSDDSLDADSIETKLTFIDDGRDDFWYNGSTTVEQDFKLKAKKD